MSDFEIVSTRRITEQLIRKHDAPDPPVWDRVVAFLQRYVNIQRQERTQ